MFICHLVCLCNRITIVKVPKKEIVMLSSFGSSDSQNFIDADDINDDDLLDTSDDNDELETA